MLKIDFYIYYLLMSYVEVLKCYVLGDFDGWLIFEWIL